MKNMTLAQGPITVPTTERILGSYYGRLPLTLTQNIAFMKTEERKKMAIFSLNGTLF